MHRNYNVIAGLSLFLNMAVSARNPFEFADQELKKYTATKIPAVQKTPPVEKRQKSRWEIVEVNNSTTRIVKDDSGNVRSISLANEK